MNAKKTSSLEKTDKSKNAMKEISIDSLILHCSSADPVKLEKYGKLLKLITNQEPAKALAVKRIPAFKIRPGLHIGYKVTVKKERAAKLLKEILVGIPKIKRKQFNPGFLSFGVKEYIEIPTIPYQRDIGITGFEVLVTLKRRGFRVKNKKLKKGKIGKNHLITKEETVNFFENNFKMNIVDEK
ncbi:MAG: 50S ribosomal protein L5 [Candidatus Pacearchaeota archaeon]|nr:50S ribosomal protein L5 [Candidatus Pacearchaeota archaeon]